MSECLDWTLIEDPGQPVKWRCNTHGETHVGDKSLFFCRVGRAEETERIVTDLIAELWDVSRDLPPDGNQEAFADRAEARLREVSGDA